jgi:hypothetical protein
MKGRALRRALQTKDAYRIGGPTEIPLIVDTTELISPDVAYELLLKNNNNRPINWQRVEEYARIMARGEWALHAQGIILDTSGNILTGQKRLWAVIYSGTAVYMRVSRGNPPTVGKLLDRGTPQSARDLASRGTGRGHSPVEASVARGILALKGNLRPSTDALAATIEAHAEAMAALLAKSAGTKKTRAVLMILAAICTEVIDTQRALIIARQLDQLAQELEHVLQPHGAAGCWGRGSLFGFALEKARLLVQAPR